MATKKSLKIIHMNARSLLFHLDEVQSFVLSHRPDILAVSETWLDLSVSDCGVFLSGYHPYRCDRLRSGGGIGVYVAEYLSCSTLFHSSGVSNHGCDYPWLSISSFKSSKGCFALGCFYWDQDCPNNNRPISILPAISKILEKHVKEHLSNPLESNNLLYSHQSGFCSGHSTASCCIVLIGGTKPWIIDNM